MPALLAVQRVPLRMVLGAPEDIEGLSVYRGGTDEGPTLVLVHGFGDSAAGWGQVIGPLARRHPVVTYDQPGHGESAPADPPLTFVHLSEGLEAVVDSIDGPVVLIGNSLGGFVALRHALDHPEGVERVVLINSGGLSYPELEGTLLMPETREGLALKNKAVFGDAARPMPGFLADAFLERQGEARLQSLWTDLRTPPFHDLDDELSALTVPVDIIWGTPDGLLPLAGYGERFETLIPDARFETLDGCAHVPQYTCANRLVLLLEQKLAD